MPWETKARDYAAEVINAALGPPPGSPRTSADVIAVSAMEVTCVPACSRTCAKLAWMLHPSHAVPHASSVPQGIGVGEALLKYHGLQTTRRRIPYTHVRTLSNWLHQPVQQVW